MEHRLHQRHPARIEVVVYRRDALVAVCRSRNLSVDGMFFEADVEALGLEMGKCVSLGLRLRDQVDVRMRRLRAVVVHRATDGVGVLFTTRETALDEALGTLAGQELEVAY